MKKKKFKKIYYFNIFLRKSFKKITVVLRDRSKHLSRWAPDKNSTSKDPHWKPNLALWIGPILSYAFMLARSLTHSAIAPNYIILLKTNEKRNPNIKPKKKKTFITQNNFYPTLIHHPPIAQWLCLFSFVFFF